MNDEQRTILVDEENFKRSEGILRFEKMETKVKQLAEAWCDGNISEIKRGLSSLNVDIIALKSEFKDILVDSIE